jgi:hypothetical protein
MKKKDHHSTHWDLMLATVKEVAADDNSSVDRLQEEFLEEFGHLPTSELIDYFADLLKNDNKKTTKKTQVQKKETIKEKTVDPEIQFTDKMATNNQVTVLAFRKSFEAAFGKKPPIELVAHFLKRMTYLRQQSPKKSTIQDSDVKVSFIKNFISRKSPTVLKFRREFEDKFGDPPNSEMVALFLKELSKSRSG